MSKLKEIVPPLELCKLIQEGAFEDSALVWASRFHYCGKKEELVPRAYVAEVREIAPAPTPEEIMDGLLLKTSDCEPRLYWQGGWHVQCAGKEGYDMTSAAAAALRLWLELKGDASHE